MDRPPILDVLAAGGPLEYQRIQVEEEERLLNEAAAAQGLPLASLAERQAATDWTPLPGQEEGLQGPYLAAGGLPTRPAAPHSGIDPRKAVQMLYTEAQKGINVTWSPYGHRPPVYGRQQIEYDAWLMRQGKYGQLTPGLVEETPPALIIPTTTVTTAPWYTAEPSPGEGGISTAGLPGWLWPFPPTEGGSLGEAWDLAKMLPLLIIMMLMSRRRN